MTSRTERRALDRWARDRGWNDFDTFIRTGGSIAEAKRNIEGRIEVLFAAKAAIGRYNAGSDLDEAKRDIDQRIVALETARPALEDAEDSDLPAIGPDALAAAEADVVGEPVDPDNAQIQGFDHASD